MLKKSLGHTCTHFPLLAMRACLLPRNLTYDIRQYHWLRSMSDLDQALYTYLRSVRACHGGRARWCGYTGSLGPETLKCALILK